MKIEQLKQKEFDRREFKYRKETFAYNICYDLDWNLWRD